MRRLILALLATVPCTGALSAQSVASGPLFQSYTMTNATDVRVRSVSLFSLPFTARADLVEGLQVGVRGAYASALVTLESGAQERASGLTDTRVWVTFGGGPLRFTGSAILPSGEVVADIGDATVVGLLSTDLMPFALSHWGTGGGFAGDVSYTLVGSASAVTLSAGGTKLSESNPLESVEPYAPAWSVRSRLAFEAAVGPAEVMSFLVGYQQFGADAFGTLDFYQPGARYEGALSYAKALGPRTSFVAFGNAYHGGGGSSDLEGLSVFELAEAFSGVGTRASRTLVRVGGEMHVLRGGYEVMPRAVLRVLRRDDGVGQGWMATIGARGGLRLGRMLGGTALRGEPSLGLRVGSVAIDEGASSGILGFEVGMTLRWDGGR